MSRSSPLESRDMETVLLSEAWGAASSARLVLNICAFLLLVNLFGIGMINPVVVRPPPHTHRRSFQVRRDISVIQVMAPDIAARKESPNETSRTQTEAQNTPRK